MKNNGWMDDRMHSGMDGCPSGIVLRMSAKRNSTTVRSAGPTGQAG